MVVNYEMDGERSVKHRYGWVVGIILLMGLLTIVGCSASTRLNDRYYAFSYHEYNGHTYIVLSARCVHFIHDPDCQCEKINCKKRI